MGIFPVTSAGITIRTFPSTGSTSNVISHVNVGDSGSVRTCAFPVHPVRSRGTPFFFRHNARENVAPRITSKSYRSMFHHSSIFFCSAPGLRITQYSFFVRALPQQKSCPGVLHSDHWSLISDFRFQISDFAGTFAEGSLTSGKKG